MASEMNDAARIVVDEASSEQAKARRVLDANPLVQAAMALSEIGYDRDVALMEVERLRADNARLQAALDTQTRGMGSLNAACRRRDETIAALRGIAQAVVDSEPLSPDDDAGYWMSCVLGSCGPQMSGEPYQHDAHCPVTRFRTLLSAPLVKEGNE